MSLVLKLVLVQNDKQRRNISCIDISTISVSPYLKMVHFYRATMSLWAMLTACVWPNSLKEIPVWNTRVAVIYIFLRSVIDHHGNLWRKELNVFTNEKETARPSAKKRRRVMKVSLCNPRDNYTGMAVHLFLSSFKPFKMNPSESVNAPRGLKSPIHCMSCTLLDMKILKAFWLSLKLDLFIPLFSTHFWAHNDRSTETFKISYHCWMCYEISIQEQTCMSKSLAWLHTVIFDITRGKVCWNTTKGFSCIHSCG